MKLKKTTGAGSNGPNPTIVNWTTKVILVGLSRDDLEKVPKRLSLKEYYARIFNWHKKNECDIFVKMSNRRRDDPYIRCYLDLIGVLPQPKSATPKDIAFVCREVIAGLMEWAYHRKDDSGVKTAAYAHYVLDRFFGGFHGKKTIQSAKSSKLYARHSMSNCLDRYRG